MYHSVPEGYGYTTRKEQDTLTKAMQDAVLEGAFLVGEGKTGVGKTLSYLLAVLHAIERGKRVVIAPHTRALQRQIMQELTKLQTMFPHIRFTFSELTGRGNYLCKQSMDDLGGDMYLHMEPSFPKFVQWSHSTETGHLADLDFVPPYWDRVAAKRETCRQRRCAYFGSCHYFRAVGIAHQTEVLVVNHALLLQDAKLREESEGELQLLPDYEYLVVDEAHHLGGVATATFSTQVTSRTVRRLCEGVLKWRLGMLDQESFRLAMTLEETFWKFLLTKREGNTDVPHKPDTYFVNEVCSTEGLNHLLLVGGELIRWCVYLADDLRKAADSLGVNRETKADSRSEKGLLFGIQCQGVSNLFARVATELKTILFSDVAGFIREVEIPEEDGLESTLSHTPINVAPVLRKTLWEPLTSAILTSATMSANGSIGYFKEELGLPEETRDCIVGSPFNWEEQARVYIPFLPDPPEKGANAVWYYTQVVNEIQKITLITKGRAFVICTSKKAMKEIYRRLLPLSPYKLFLQGEAPPQSLLDQFVASGGILIGTAGFGEGVNIPGDALGCVIIDKIPFDVPTQPLVRARCLEMEERSINPFMNYTLPRAQIKLAQYGGRTIRTTEDTGIICLLDNRSFSKKSYAWMIRGSFPPAPIIRKVEDLQAFWKEKRPHEV